MSKIKLPHASGNSMAIAAPATNPASDLELKLPATIGSANQYMKVDGSGNLGWVTPPAGGKIGQVQFRVLTDWSQFTTSSTSHVDISNFGIDITPSATDSKILILGNLLLRSSYGSGSETQVAMQLLRGSTNISGEISEFHRYQVGGGEADHLAAGHLHQFVDSPNTTSATTYKYQMRIAGGGGTLYVNTRSTITAWEILA